MTCRVYRHFDETGTLLYVGIAACALRRLDQHRLRSKWFGDVRRVHIDPCESREEALRLEQIAIKHERPLYNGPVGRPKIVGDRPWHIEGISRATWYRKLGMSKLDQLKALGDAKRAARKIIPVLAAKPQISPTVHGGKAVGRTAGSSPATGAKLKRGRGRPKVEGPPPWEVAGVSRATWHRRRQKEQKND